MRLKSIALLGLLVASMLPGSAARAETVSVAVAANFSDAAKAIGAAFKAKTGNDVSISSGATGALYTQISQGAPFEVFLSADSSTPKKAAKAGFADAGTDFTYAVGKLVLFSAEAALVTGADTLKAGKFDKIAIADPKTAPYGAAAVEAMRALGVYDALSSKIVTGSSIAQAYQFVDSGNAELGFVALSQVVNRKDGSRWLVPQADYAPITQDAVLLEPGKDSQAAKDFLAFLRSDAAVRIIRSFGYEVGE
ncbi:MAG TPA: molybdate ABC transporter substrate-binding protein [Devosia sp.]|nr:molybdate ABC transporter substrate-binding protein [Devosia sp.]